MTTFYFDTSAIVKRYRKELGSEVIDEIFELKEHAFTISFWSILEFMVAFSTRTRKKALSREAFNAVVSRFLKDVLDRFAMTSVDDELIASAAPLAVKHALPSADCLQLANAINLKEALESMREELILICSDKDLCKAAEKEGIRFINPEEEGASEKLSKLV
ncbi:MAG: type II toxin-antitoxin system VapC family toxin [Candidatus Bathyarchaeia archaeon]